MEVRYWLSPSPVVSLPPFNSPRIILLAIRCGDFYFFNRHRNRCNSCSSDLHRFWSLLWGHTTTTIKRQMCRTRDWEVFVVFWFFVNFKKYYILGDWFRVHKIFIRPSFDIIYTVFSFLIIVLVLLQVSLIAYLKNFGLIGTLFINYVIIGLFLTNTSILVYFVTIDISYINIFSNSTISQGNIWSLDEFYFRSETQKLLRVLNSFFFQVGKMFLFLSFMFLIRLCPSIQTASKISNLFIAKEDNVSTTSTNAIFGVNKNRMIVRIISFFVGFLINGPLFTIAILIRYLF